MSDHLISRREVLETLETVFGKYNIAFGNNYGGFADAVRNAVENMESAYDVDKVVNQLKIAADKACCKVDKNDDDTSYDYIYQSGIEGGLLKALKIVKGGGAQ